MERLCCYDDDESVDNDTENANGNNYKDEDHHDFIIFLIIYGKFDLFCKKIEEPKKIRI